MGSDMEIRTDSPEDIILMPTGRLTRDEIRKIPVGAHILQANVEQDGVTFVGGIFKADSKQAWIDQLEDEDEAFENTTVFYVRPEKLKDPDVPLVDVPTAEEIADRVLKEFSEEKYKTIQEMTVRAVELARQGLVQNPF